MNIIYYRVTYSDSSYNIVREYEITWNTSKTEVYGRHTENWYPVSELSAFGNYSDDVAIEEITKEEAHNQIMVWELEK